MIAIYDRRGQLYWCGFGCTLTWSASPEHARKFRLRMDAWDAVRRASRLDPAFPDETYLMAVDLEDV